MSRYTERTEAVSDKFREEMKNTLARYGPMHTPATIFKIFFSLFFLRPS